jgi:hypothetical protein
MFVFASQISQLPKVKSLSRMKYVTHARPWFSLVTVWQTCPLGWKLFELVLLCLRLFGLYSHIQPQFLTDYRTSALRAVGIEAGNWVLHRHTREGHNRQMDFFHNPSATRVFVMRLIASSGSRVFSFGLCTNLRGRKRFLSVSPESNFEVVTHEENSILVIFAGLVQLRVAKVPFH